MQLYCITQTKKEKKNVLHFLAVRRLEGQSPLLPIIAHQEVHLRQIPINRSTSGVIAIKSKAHNIIGNPNEGVQSAKLHIRTTEMHSDIRG